MPYDYNQSRELHGIGSSLSRGTKRTADSLSHPYGSIQGKPVWKKNPSKINTVSTRKPQNTVPNPYNGISAGGRGLVQPNGSNPTASRTVTDAMPSKKRKISGGPSETISSKFWMEHSPSRGSSSRESRAVPSTVRTDAGVTRTGWGIPHSNRDSQPARNNREIPLLADPRTPSAEVISIDESGSDVDKYSGTVIRHSPPPSDNADEIDLIDQPIDQPLSLKLSRKSYQSENLSVAQELGVPEPGLDHPFLSKDTSSLYTRAISPAQARQARRIAKDGVSTKRLGGRLRVHKQQDTSAHASATPSSPLTPPPPLSADGNEDNDEIEDAEGFSSILTASSSKTTAAGWVQSRLSSRTSASGSSTIKRGRVKQMADEIEEKSKANGLRFIPDLKQVGNQKSRIGGMKRKNPSTALSNRGKGSTSRNGVSSRDALATAQTPYAPALTLPLDVCVWGTQKYELRDNESQPDYWLYWNEDATELQLHRHPLVNLKALNKRKCVHSIKLSLLKSCEFSNDSDVHLVKIELDSKSRRSLSGEIPVEGLTFKFLSQHPNMSCWEPLHSRMKALVAKEGKNLQRVVGPGTMSCLQTALASADVPEAKTRRKRKEAAHNTSADPTLANEANTHVQKKKQPRPRPANGRNQNIAEMFNEGSTRHSTRLLSEASKQEESSVNLDEIILVYPPSGQGAVHITNGDLRRLEPSEFLNDTLIELGLKFWLSDLRTQQPELAEDVHVFSSFFFKKLASKNNKTPEDGHKSVRKWTAKVDIFKKKYIIVPINENIHWYLAIIYHPEHILEPSLPKSPSRSSKRVSDAAANKQSSALRKGVAAVAVETKSGGSSSREGPAEAPPSSPITKENDSEAEAEVEKELTDDADISVMKSFRSCSLDESQTILRIHSESPDGDATYPIQQTGDRPSSKPVPFDQVETNNLLHDRGCAMGDDFPMELGHVEGGGPSTRPAIVEDSLSEDSDDSEVDQLDEDDVPSTSRMADSGFATPLPSRTDAQEPSSFTSDDGASLMDVDEPQKEDSVPLPENSIDNSADQLCEQEYQAPHVAVDEATSMSGLQHVQHRSPSPVPHRSFYAHPNRNIKTYEDRKRSPADFISGRSNGGTEKDELDILADHEAERESSEEPEVTERPRTIIFCMDSLGSSHPKALNRLNEYLQEEAKDKKGIENPSSALTKKALVPAQPNFCDCGLYLLHFAQTFMTDPEKYKAAILATKKSAAADRNILWLNEQVGTMREQMKARILAESEKWKKLRAQREQENKDASAEGDAGQPLQVEQSDDEIEVSEVRHVGSSPKKQSKKASPNPAARIR